MVITNIFLRDLLCHHKCFFLGSCIGVCLLVEVTPTAQECLQLCNSTLGCRWFTYYQSVSECVLFRNCPTVDNNSCEDCISGERRCIYASTSTTTTTTAEPTAPTSTAPISTTTVELPKGHCFNWKLYPFSSFKSLLTSEVVEHFKFL